MPLSNAGCCCVTQRAIRPNHSLLQLFWQLFAYEELGRSQKLLDLWRRSQSGSPVTSKEINEVCTNHEEKQRAGMLSTVLRGTRELASANFFGIL